uniref:Uncharacterized protein n=1 Tax=Peromyscus maniculatus bairdii TaxID=230844 RepID=A0A8C8T7X4_PERMB
MKTSSGSFEQSFPVAALSNCRIILFSSARLSGTKTTLWGLTLTYCFAFRTPRSSWTEADRTNSAAISSILAKPSALEALSRASWKSSLSARLISMTDLLSSAAPLSSALVHSSAQLSCRPDSRKLPVDFNSIPAMSLGGQTKSFPACASPPRM